jgi:6-phosphogluconolactonase
VVAVGLAFLPASLRAEFVYVANAGSNNVSAYRIAENGALTPVVGSPFPAGSDPRSLAVDLFRRFVCVANALSNNVSVYRIGANGGLTLVAGSPFPAGSNPRSLAFSP